MNVKISFKEVIESYPHFDQLSSFINDNSYYPSKKDVFRCFDIDQIKVVILGQDPQIFAHQVWQTDGKLPQTGLSFSVHRKHTK